MVYIWYHAGMHKEGISTYSINQDKVYHILWVCIKFVYDYIGIRNFVFFKMLEIFE